MSTCFWADCHAPATSTVGHDDGTWEFCANHLDEHHAVFAEGHPCPVCGDAVPARESSGAKRVYCSATCRNFVAEEKRRGHRRAVRVAA